MALLFIMNVLLTLTYLIVFYHSAILTIHNLTLYTFQMNTITTTITIKQPHALRINN